MSFHEGLCTVIYVNLTALILISAAVATFRKQILIASERRRPSYRHYCARISSKSKQTRDNVANPKPFNEAKAEAEAEATVAPNAKVKEEPG